MLVPILLGLWYHSSLVVRWRRVGERVGVRGPVAWVGGSEIVGQSARITIHIRLGPIHEASNKTSIKLPLDQACDHT